MNTFTFFIIFTPILAMILLLVNLILAPHVPYLEKKSVFECGFHSFLTQNRSPFNINFFVYGIMFLIFDLEILLGMPYSVSAYIGELSGMAIFVLFMVILGIGLFFELGKKALDIDSRQSSNSNTELDKSDNTNFGSNPLISNTFAPNTFVSSNSFESTTRRYFSTTRVLSSDNSGNPENNSDNPENNFGNPENSGNSKDN